VIGWGWRCRDGLEVGDGDVLSCGLALIGTGYSGSRFENMRGARGVRESLWLCWMGKAICAFDSKLGKLW
jgi:hypothetical protein